MKLHPFDYTDPLVIKFTYHNRNYTSHGKAMILLEEMLSERSIQVFKRLMKLIRMDDNTDIEKKVKQWLIQAKEYNITEYSKVKTELITLRDIVSADKNTVDSIKSIRDQYKRSSQEWKQENETLKKVRQIQKDNKRELQLYQQTEKLLCKDKAFIDKCIEYLEK